MMVEIRGRIVSIQLVILITVSIGLIAFSIRSCRNKPDKTPKEVIADSIKIIRSLKELHADSAQFYGNQFEILTYKADSLAQLDSAAMDRRRAEYRANWYKQNSK